MVYINNVPIFIPMPNSYHRGNDKGGREVAHNKFFVYGVLVFTIGISALILDLAMEILFDNHEMVSNPIFMKLLFIWGILSIFLLFISVLYKYQTEKEIFESIGRDLIRLCNLFIIGFVVVIGIMIYDIVAQKEVMTQTTANIIMGSAIGLNIIRYIVCAKRKKNTKKMRKKKENMI